MSSSWRIVIPVGAELQTVEGTRPYHFARFVRDVLSGDRSISAFPKILIAKAICDKLKSASGHVFLDDEEFHILKAALRMDGVLPFAALEAADHGYQLAIESAQEFVLDPNDGALKPKEDPKKETPR